MTTSRYRFEPLEPRILLSGIGLLRGDPAPVAARAALAPEVPQPEMLPTATVQQQAEPARPPLPADPPMVEQPAIVPPVELDEAVVPPAHGVEEPEAPPSPVEQQAADRAIDTSPEETATAVDATQPVVRESASVTAEVGIVASDSRSIRADAAPKADDSVIPEETGPAIAEADPPPRADPPLGSELSSGNAPVAEGEDVAIVEPELLRTTGALSADEAPATDHVVAPRIEEIEPVPSNDFAPRTDAALPAEDAPVARSEPEPVSDVAPTNMPTQSSEAFGLPSSIEQLTAVAAEDRTVREKPRAETNVSADGRLAQRQEDLHRTESVANTETGTEYSPATAAEGEHIVSQPEAQAGKGTAGAGRQAEGEGADAEVAAAAGLGGLPAAAKGDRAAKTAASAKTPADDPERPLEANQASTAGDTLSDAPPAPMARPSTAPPDADGGIPLAGLVDQAFAEERPTQNGRRAASETLVPVEGALLVVTLGKPLSRLAGGDRGCDAATDGGSPSLQPPQPGSKHDRRKTADSRGKGRRRNPSRDLAWLLPEDPATHVPEAASRPACEQAITRPQAAVAAPRLTDLAVLSCLATSTPEDRPEHSESRGSTAPSVCIWEDGELIAAVAGGATLTGMISWLAVDRCRRATSHRRPVKFKPPQYTGRTMARAI